MKNRFMLYLGLALLAILILSVAACSRTNDNRTMVVSRLPLHSYYRNGLPTLPVLDGEYRYISSMLLKDGIGEVSLYPRDERPEINAPRHGPHWRQIIGTGPTVTGEITDIVVCGYLTRDDHQPSSCDLLRLESNDSDSVAGSRRIWEFYTDKEDRGHVQEPPPEVTAEWNRALHIALTQFQTIPGTDS